jgi:hypothetical protein
MYRRINVAIRISEVKRIREELNMTHLIIFAIDDKNNYHVATHGKTRIQAKQAAKAGNILKKQLGFPDDLCKSEPLERICGNCDYWKRLRLPGYPIEEYGKCYYEINQIDRNEKNKACHNFEPEC